MSGSCLAERLEPGVLHPYQHVLQRGGRQAPSHHAVNPGLHSITLEPKVSSSICRPPMLPNKSRLRRRRSQDQAHGTAAQAERRRRGACFPSMINAVRSSADTAQDFKDQRASSSRAASTRGRFSASLLGPAGFFFTSSLGTTHFLPTVPQLDVGGADGLKKRRMFFFRTLCETCVADSLRPPNMRYLQVGQRVGRVRYMCAV